MTKTIGYQLSFEECDHFEDITLKQFKVFYWNTWYCRKCRCNRTIRFVNEIIDEVVV